MATVWTDDLAAGYVAAMIDGEGTVYFNSGGGRIRGRKVSVCVADKELIDAYIAACKHLGIQTWYYLRDFPSWRARGKPPLHEAGISHNEDFAVLAERVPLRSHRKRRKLEQLLASYKQHHRRRRS